MDDAHYQFNVELYKNRVSRFILCDDRYNNSNDRYNNSNDRYNNSNDRYNNSNDRSNNSNDRSNNSNDRSNSRLGDGLSDRSDVSTREFSYHQKKALEMERAEMEEEKLTESIELIILVTGCTKTEAHTALQENCMDPIEAIKKFK